MCLGKYRISEVFLIFCKYIYLMFRFRAEMQKLLLLLLVNLLYAFLLSAQYILLLWLNFLYTTGA